MRMSILMYRATASSSAIPARSLKIAPTQRKSIVIIRCDLQSFKIYLRSYMSIKNFVKRFLGRIRCLKAKITYQGGVCIGKQCSILGGRKISLGSNVTIRPYVDLWAAGRGIAIGAESEIGERCRISIVNKLDIGEMVLISPDVYKTDCDHAYENINIPVIEQGVIKKDNKVSIGGHSYIGIHSVMVGM